MISWIVVAVLVLIAIVLLKTNHFRHRMWISILVILALFFYVSITFIYANNDLAFNSTDSALNSFKVYYGWLANGFYNLKAITGNAIKMDWKSSDKTFFNKTLIKFKKK